MPLSKAEAGRLGGQARARNLTPERKAEIMRKAHLAGAIKRIVDQAPELTEDQLETLRTILAPVAGESVTK
jgi:hypothetical protein